MVLKEFFAKLGLDTDAASFARGQLAVEGIKVGLTALVGAARTVGRGLAHMVTSVVETADKIDETAQAAGVSTTALQELAYAGTFSGLSLEGTGHALGLLAKNMQAARDGSKTTAAAFYSLGVRVDDGRGHIRNADEVLGDLAEKFAAMPDSATKTALAMKLFGRSGAQMIPFLNEGRAGLARLRQEAEDTGNVLDEASVAAGRDAADAFGRFGKATTGLKNTLVSALLPGLTRITKAFSAWIVEHRQIIGLRFRQVIDGITGALEGLWSMGSAVVEIFQSLGNSLRTNVWDELDGSVKSAAKWFAVLGAAILVPFGPLIALGMLLEDIWVGLHGGKSVTGEAFAALDKWLQPTGADPWWKTAIIEFAGALAALPGLFEDAFQFWRGKIIELRNLMDPKGELFGDLKDIANNVDYSHEGRMGAAPLNDTQLFWKNAALKARQAQPTGTPATYAEMFTPTFYTPAPRAADGASPVIHQTLSVHVTANGVDPEGVMAKVTEGLDGLLLKAKNGMGT